MSLPNLISLFKEKEVRQFEVIIGERGRKMLVPTKNIHEERSLVKIGARNLSFLDTPLSVNTLWEHYKRFQDSVEKIPKINYDVFILSLDFLYIIDAIEYKNDLIWRKKL